MKIPFEDIPVPMLLISADGAIMHTTPTAVRMLGGERPHMAQVLAPGESWDALREELQKQPEQRRKVTLMIVAAGAQAISAELRFSPYAADGVADGTNGYLVTVQDRTEIEALHQRILDRQRSQSFLKSATSDLLVRTDADYTITWCNEAAGAYFQVGQGLKDLLSPACMEELRGWLASEPSTADSSDDGVLARRTLVLESRPDHAPRFVLQGVARRLSDESGVFAGLSMVAHDESDARRIAQFAADYQLSSREEEIFQHLVAGYSNLNIAMILGISESGVKFHVKNIMTKAKAATRTELLSQLFRF